MDHFVGVRFALFVAQCLSYTKINVLMLVEIRASNKMHIGALLLSSSDVHVRVCVTVLTVRIVALQNTFERAEESVCADELWTVFVYLGKLAYTCLRGAQVAVVL